MSVKKAFAIGCSSLFIFIIIGILFLGWAMFGDHSKHVVNAPSHRLAPTQAIGIEYFENPNIAGIVSVTYSISHNDFRQFADQMGWTLTEKHDLTFINTPSAFADRNLAPLSLNYCLFYEDRHPNGGGITVVYVPQSSRAYINTSNR